MTVTDEMLFANAAQARDIWLSTLPDESALPEFRCSGRFERKMRGLIKEQRRSKRTNQVLYFARQTIAAVLAVAVLTFGGMMTVEAYREKFIEIVVQVFSELTHYRFASDTPASEVIELPEIALGHIPDGMQIKEDKISLNNRRYIRYDKENGEFFELRQRPITADGDHLTILDTEDSVYEMTIINGYEVYCNEKGSNVSAFWADRDIVYKLYGNIEMTELKKIIEKIKIF